MSWDDKRDEADFVASSIAGLLDVFNEIEITPPTPNAADTEKSIKKALAKELV